MNKLTGIKDVDLNILQELEDSDFPEVCRVNQYINQLCNEESFWLRRLLNNSPLNAEYWRKVKGNFKWKEIYQYYSGKRKVGSLEAARKDNVYLYKMLFRYIDTETYIETLKLAAANGATDVMTYVLFNGTKEEFQEGVDAQIMFSLHANTKSSEWLDLMDQLDYSSHIVKLIEQKLDPIPEIADFVPQINNGFDAEGIMYAVGESLRDFDIESRKKIVEYLVSENPIFLGHLQTSVDSASKIPNRNTARQWSSYIENFE